jgi:hypothetical protein
MLRTGLELLSLPFFLAACDMPQAVGLYWLANSSAHYMLQRVSSRPAVAKALGLPLLLVQPTTKKEAEGEQLGTPVLLAMLLAGTVAMCAGLEEQLVRCWRADCSTCCLSACGVSCCLLQAWGHAQGST